jgi:hypothetical protein
MLLPLWLFVLPPVAACIEARDSRGLAVVVESIAEPVAVNGLPVHVTRAHGPEVATLAQRIADRWRSERSMAQQIQHQGWHVLSRWNGVRSEVLQWRNEGAEAELLFSWLDATQKPRVMAAPPLALPFHCAWSRTVEGESRRGRFSQHLAHCRAAPNRLAPEIAAALARKNWIVVHRRGQEWDVVRERQQARVVVVAGVSPEESALIWTSMPEGGSP